MSKEQTAIGPWLYLPLLIIPVMGYGFMNMPYYGAKAMGANGYLGEVIAAFLALPGIAAIYLLTKRFPGQTIIEQGNSILGSFLGRITGVIYLLYCLVLLSMFTRDSINLVGAYFLDRTPIYAIALLYLLPTAFIASRGIETVSRLASFVLIPALLVIIGLTILGFQNFEWTRVLPITSPSIVDYFKGGFSVVYIYYLMGASSISLMFLKPLKSFPRIAGGALLFLAIFYGIYTFGTIGVFGHQYIVRYAWPSLEFLHNVDFPYLFLEQAGLIMLIDWIALILVGSGYLYYVVALGSSKVTGSLDYKRWVWLLLPLKFVMIIFPANVAQTKQIVDFIIKIGWIFLFAYPIILWLIAVLLKRRGLSANES